MQGNGTIEREAQYRLSRHAKERLQQRGKTLTSVETMLSYGKKRWHGDALVVYMDKRHRKKVQAQLEPEVYRQVVDRLDFHLVYNDDTGEIITVAHRLNRLKW